MSQSRLHSFVEANLNTFAGFGISWCLSYWVVPLGGLPQSPSVATKITLLFTAVSLVRNYLLRRLFNRFYFAWPARVRVSPSQIAQTGLGLTLLAALLGGA